MGIYQKGVRIKLMIPENFHKISHKITLKCIFLKKPPFNLAKFDFVFIVEVCSFKWYLSQLWWNFLEFQAVLERCAGPFHKRYFSIKVVFENKSVDKIFMVKLI